MATGFPISIGHAVPIVAILHFILSREVSISLEPVLARDRSRSLSVCDGLVCCSSDVGRGVKLSARGERGVTMVSWTMVSAHYGSLPEPTECLQPAASPCPIFGRPASGGPSVVGPFRCYWDQPIPFPFRLSSASPRMGIPGYWPTIGYAHYGPLYLSRRSPLLILAGAPTRVSGAVIFRGPRG